MIDEWNVVHLHLPAQSRIVVKPLFKPLFLYYCSSLGRPPFTFYQHIQKVWKYLQCLMLLILKLHFHAKSIRYFSNGRYKLVTFWMIIQWTRNNWHKESFRVRTTTTIISFLENNYIEFWRFFLLIAFLVGLLNIA